MGPAGFHRSTSFPPQAPPDPSAQTSRSPHKTLPRVRLRFLSLPGITSQTATAAHSMTRRQQQRRPPPAARPDVDLRRRPRPVARRSSRPRAPRPAHRPAALAHFAPRRPQAANRRGLPRAVGRCGEPRGPVGGRAVGLGRTRGWRLKLEASENEARPRLSFLRKGTFPRSRRGAALSREKLLGPGAGSPSRFLAPERPQLLRGLPQML